MVFYNGKNRRYQISERDQPSKMGQEYCTEFIDALEIFWTLAPPSVRAGASASHRSPTVVMAMRLVAAQRNPRPPEVVVGPAGLEPATTPL
jgi:hypothetical protein